MKIYVDADACPVTRIVEKVAKEFSVTVCLLCDTNHVLTSDYSEVCIIGAGAEAVDIALINKCKIGDIVVTQDYGVAAMALGKKAYAINQNGKIFTNDNIGGLLMDRHLAKKSRMSKSKHHLKGPKKRTKQNDIDFENSITELISRLI